MNEGLESRLTLISAPAGFGKTTLVSEWLAANDRHAAWLSLDEADSDLARFLTHLIAALQSIDATVGVKLLGQLQAPNPPPTEVTLVDLLDDLKTVPEPIILVLDDYHAVDSRDVDDVVRFLVEHSSPNLHLVITTREDPQLPLARLRARDQLTEIRAADLRFTQPEAADFLTGVMNLALSAADIAALTARTEGWIAGLQLASLSMKGRDDLPGFIAAFAGVNRYIMDFLVTEVLQRLPERVRSFLLQTSILERLNGSLCEAVTCQEDGRAMLEALERGNFFLVPLDDSRHWYRYHHLFAGVLTAHLHEERQVDVADLHRRASEWFEHHGSIADAVNHALTAEDYQLAARLVEQATPALRKSRQEARLLNWLKALPTEVVAGSPFLGVMYAHALLASGELGGVADRLDAAEHLLDSKWTRTDSTQELLAQIAVARAGLALARGDVTSTEALARRVLDLAPVDDHFNRGAAVAFLGLAYWTKGDLQTAHSTYRDSVAQMQAAGNLPDAVGGHNALAAICMAQGRLRRAEHTYERGLQLTTQQEPPPRGTADLYVGLSEIACERNDLLAATQLLQRASELGEHLGFPQYRYRWRVAMARIRSAQADLPGAMELLDEAERHYSGDFHPNIRPIAASRTRVWLAQGKLDDAIDWVRESGLSTHDDLDYLREFEHVTLARVLIAEARVAGEDRYALESLALLQRLLQAAEQGGRIGSSISILVALALCHQALDQTPAAREALAHALALAEPEGYFRIFVDEGLALVTLLREAPKSGVTADYVRRLRGALRRTAATESARDEPLDGPLGKHLVSEPLSERERQVLRLLSTDLSGVEIAGQLRVSVNTLRTHTKNVYGKLDVNSRRAAVRRAEELELL